MNAIELLKAQHRLVDSLFEELEQAEDDDERETVFQRLADNFAAHATIEEEIFYPQAYGEKTKDLLKEAVEEHLSAKRVIADLLELEPDDDNYAAKIKVLKEQIGHHVEEEEGELFPEVEKQFGREQLEVLGKEMEALFAKEMRDDPSSKITEQTDEAARLP
jgi:hemerythrin superfamily protein